MNKHEYYNIINRFYNILFTSSLIKTHLEIFKKVTIYSDFMINCIYLLINYFSSNFINKYDVIRMISVINNYI